ncbi:TPA: hypothetical protein L4S39_000402 [Pseudomonas aeruginosa]|uniref:hypothetical protein n=1 Tax=Pseudomonas aeruginosa TaxID=287 RepID=UPI000D68C0AE|nr:hypothetical protein [Pseudomonas aeruginosa]HBO3486362.1 hypothetical protein [Pseudomonas aeruginosa]
MRAPIRLVGVEQAQARLREAGRRVDPVMRGALNTTATQTRKQRYNEPMRPAFTSAFTNRRIVIKRARAGRMNARLIPSSSGVNVTAYRRWIFEPINSTRARIYVVGPNGRKVAAGFVNPSGRLQRPLSTRSQRARTARGRSPNVTSYTYRRALQEAQGPSVAYWFRLLTTGKTIRWTNAFLRQEFERRIRRELEKAV